MPTYQKTVCHLPLLGRFKNYQFMKRYLFTLIIAIVFGPLLKSQNHDTIPTIELTVISEVNQGCSSLTLPLDIGNIERLWFEGNLIPNFYVRRSKNSRLMGVFTPQIIVRMYRTRSNPVQTPSYMPQLSVYYLFSGKTKPNKLTLFGRLGHHSNGMDGDFLLADGTVNTQSGDFSTNFFELGFITTATNKRFHAYQFYKSSLEVHPNGWTPEKFDGIYSKVRWHNTISLYKLPAGGSSFKLKKAQFSVKGEATWMFGGMRDVKFASFKRLNLGLTLYYLPKFLEDIGFFMNVYHGSDYYNIYFDKTLNVVRFGIMTEKLRF